MSNSHLTIAKLSPYLFARAMDDGFQYISFKQMKEMKMSTYAGQIAGSGGINADLREVYFWKYINYLTQFLDAIPEDGIDNNGAIEAVREVFFDDEKTGKDLCTTVDNNFKVVEEENPSLEV